MGTVSLAAREDGNFRRVYALKRLKFEYRNNSRVRSMFLEEARIAGLIHHPNVVSVVDVGDDEDGPFLVMDYVQGIPLSDLIKTSEEGGKFLPMQLCLQVVAQVARGLHAAHELRDQEGRSLQLVHRDVSPQNIIVGFDGLVRLTDFGIAKAFGRQDRTNTGVLKGKFGYFSPEQLRFEDPNRRSDLFALGVVLFETLGSCRLYPVKDEAATARAILNEQPPDIDDVRGGVHPAVVELLFRLLAKDPALRPASAEEVADQLESVLVDLAAEEGAMSVAKYMVERFEGRQREQALELEHLTTNFDLHPISDRPHKRDRGKRALYFAATGAFMAALLGGWMLAARNSEPLEQAPPTAPPVVTPVSPEPGVAESPDPPKAEDDMPPEDTIVTEDRATKGRSTRTSKKTATKKRQRAVRERAKSEPQAPVPNPTTKGLMTWEDYNARK